MTDSFYNVTLFRIREGIDEEAKPGLHHLGFEVDSLKEVEARFRESGATGRVAAEPGDAHHGDMRIYDPDGIPVSLSERGFGVCGEQRRFPRIRHVAFATPDPTRTMGFYRDVLGVTELPTSLDYRKRGKPNRFAGDGQTNFAIHPYPGGRGQDPRPGFNHIGFLVSDVQSKLRRLEGVVRLSPRPADRPYAEFRFKDREGNAVDLAQTKGWEVDVDKWERAGAAA